MEITVIKMRENLLQAWGWMFWTCLLGILIQIVLMIFDWTYVLFYGGEKTAAIVWTCIYGGIIFVLTFFIILAYRMRRKVIKTFVVVEK